MISNLKLTAIRSDGERFSYENADWGITELKGLDSTDISVFREPKAFGHGDIITGLRKSSREIEISAKLRSHSNLMQERQHVINFHNANYTYRLEITYLGVTRAAKNCVLSALRYPTGNIYHNPLLTLMYISPEADLFENKYDTTAFTSRKAMWHSTRVYEGKKGTLAFGEITKVNEKTISYFGSEPTPIKVIVYASGYVNGINITLKEHKLKISETLSEGDILIIDGVSRQITKNETLVSFSKYDANILYRMKLQYGDNTLMVDSGDNTAFSAEVEYEGRYGGM